jgi:DNA modification methylase
MRFVGCDLSPEYAQMARERIGKANPLLDACDVASAVKTPASEPTLFGDMTDAPA